MSASDVWTAICALVFMVLVAGGLDKLQVWLEQ
jgi:hypothetical protein